MVGNLDGDGYLAATEEELAIAYRGPQAGGSAHSTAQNGHLPAFTPEAPAHADAPIPALAAAAQPGLASNADLELMRGAIELVQHLDPAGVGARDLRECLLLQVAAQQNEFEELYGRPLAAAHGREPASQLSGPSRPED